MIGKQIFCKSRAQSAKQQSILNYSTYNLSFSYSNPSHRHCKSQLNSRNNHHLFNTLIPSTSTSHHKRYFPQSQQQISDNSSFPKKKVILFRGFSDSHQTSQFICAKFPKRKTISAEQQLVKQLIKFTDKFINNVSTRQTLQSNRPLREKVDRRELKPRLKMKQSWLGVHQLKSRLKSTLDPNKEQNLEQTSSSCLFLTYQQ